MPFVSFLPCLSFYPVPWDVMAGVHRDKLHALGTVYSEQEPGYLRTLWPEPPQQLWTANPQIFSQVRELSFYLV